MRGVKIQKQEHSSAVHKMVATLAVTFAVLAGTILLYSQEIVSVTGYSVLPELYGSFAPLFLVICVVVLIAVYVKLVKED